MAGFSSDSARSATRARKGRRTRDRTFNEQIMEEIRMIRGQQEHLLQSVTSVASNVHLMYSMLSAYSQPAWWPPSSPCEPFLAWCATSSVTPLTMQQHAADASKAPEVGHISEQPEPEHSPMKIASSGGSLGEWHQTDLSNESFEINEFYNVQVHNMEVQTEPVARDEFSDLFGTVSFHKRIVDSMEASLHLTGTWSRLADAKLAQDRVARLRKLAAAPAKPSAMINRSYSLCSSDEGEEGDSDCVCTLEDGDSDEEDAVLDVFLDALTGSMSGDPANKNVIKEAYTCFVRGRVARGDTLADAKAEASSVLKSATEAQKAIRSSG